MENTYQKDDYQFGNFLKRLEERQLNTNITANGSATIQQSERNELRREGVDALLHDLNLLYGSSGIDIVETRDGIVFAVENKGDFTISWELKSTIKGLEYDPFIEADKYDDEKAIKLSKKQAKEAASIARANAIKLKREKKLEEIAAARQQGR